jgi:hypothetical protein
VGWGQSFRPGPVRCPGCALLAGRPFVPADASQGATAIIVNATFADWIGGVANAVGQQVRHTATEVDTEPGPWLEIVGVVADFADGFTSPSSFDPAAARLFHAMTPGQASPAILVVRVRAGRAAAFASRFREIAAAVDPTLTFDRLESVGDSFRQAQRAFWYTALGIAGTLLSVLLLSAAGIYAMMSFTVARRRREIGIRSALGADPRRVLTGVFARAVAQLGAGVLAGLVIAGALELIGDGTMGGRAAILLPAVSLLILVIGTLAALGPARRGLAVQPTEALRED